MKKVGTELFTNTKTFKIVMKNYSCLFFLLTLLFAACGNMTEQDVENTEASGVVLVQNRSYYEIVLSDGESLYFTSVDDEGDITGLAFDEDSVEVSTSYGTGFFISDNGELATNAHVVSNVTSDKEINKSMSDIINALKKIMASQYYDYKEKYEEARQACDYANYSDDVNYEDYYNLCNYRDALKEQCDECAETYNNLDQIDANASEIKYHNEVSIALNDTYVTKQSDFIPCVVVRTDHTHDLAIVQTKNKQTPDGRYVFSVPDADPLENYSLTDKLTKALSTDKNSKLYMISYNLGPTLAITKEGVKSQINSGAISQRTSERLMYSIPTLPGSSGSPVVNMQGEVVAINYAGLQGTQNFNYGIRVKYLKDLLEE